MPETRGFCPDFAGETMRRLSAAMVLACAIPIMLAGAAQAQDSSDERRCTGPARAAPEERIASCTALIASGKYQSANLAVLHQDRGLAQRAKGDLGAAADDFSEAIKLNPDYARALAERGSVRVAQHELDDAIKLDANDAKSFMTRGNAFDEKHDFDSAIADYNEAIRLSPNYAAAYFNRALA